MPEIARFERYHAAATDSRYEDPQRTWQAWQLQTPYHLHLLALPAEIILHVLSYLFLPPEPLHAAPTVGGHSVISIPRPEFYHTDHDPSVQICVRDYKTCRLVCNRFRALVADLTLIRRHLRPLARINLRKPRTVLRFQNIQYADNIRLASITELFAEVWSGGSTVIRENNSSTLEYDTTSGILPGLTAMRSFHRFVKLKVLAIGFSLQCPDAFGGLNDETMNALVQGVSRCENLKHLSMLDFPPKVRDTYQTEIWTGLLQRLESFGIRMSTYEGDYATHEASEEDRFTDHFGTFWLLPLSRHSKRLGMGSSDWLDLCPLSDKLAYLGKDHHGTSIGYFDKLEEIKIPKEAVTDKLFSFLDIKKPLDKIHNALIDLGWSSERRSIVSYIYFKKERPKSQVFSSGNDS